MQRDPLLSSNGQQKRCDSLYIGLFHVIPSVALTLGRVFIGSGMSLFNFEKTAETFGWHDKAVINAIAYVIVMTTAIDTLIGRGASNFLRCMPPTIYITDQVINENTLLSEFDRQFPMTLLRETYVIRHSYADSKAMLYRRNNDKIKEYTFDENTQERLNTLYQTLAENNTDQATPTVLSIEHLNQFYTIKTKQEPPTWSKCTTTLYWNIFIPAASTAIFSSLAAILYLYTFAEKFYNETIFDEIFVALGVAVNFLTYCTFNIRNMNENITRACQRYQDGEPLNNVLFGTHDTQNASRDTTKQIVFTCVLATLGMIGQLSAAYYVMFKLLELPSSHTVCDALDISVEKTAITLALLNIYGSFYSGVFNMAMNSHRLITEEKTNHRTTIDIILSLNTFLNASINAMQSFLGTATLTGQEHIDWSSPAGVSLCALRMTITLGYLYLSYGMMRQGNERSIQYFNQKATLFNCHTTNYQGLSSQDLDTSDAATTNPLSLNCNSGSTASMTTVNNF